MVYKSKKELFENERKEFVNKLLSLLGINDNNKEFCLNLLLLKNENTKKELENMINNFRVYYKTVSSLKPCYENSNKLKNPVLTMIKSVFKQENIKYFMKKKTIKLEKGKYKSMNVYEIL